MLDTNVLISASLKPDGLEARVARMAVAGLLEACVTDAVLAEYREVLGREKFRACRETADCLLAELTKRTLHLIAGPPVQAAGDDDDNRFLECAAAAGAEFLVTGNLRHYPVVWGSTRVVNARTFLDLFPVSDQKD